MKTAVVFGGSGYIGSNTVYELLNRGYKVINADIKELKIDHKNYKYKNFTAYDYGEVLRLLSDKKDINLIFNFAGISDIKQCNTWPSYSLDVNIKINTNILNSIYAQKIYPLYIYASSLYAASSKAGIYSISKRTNEDLIKYYSEKYKFDYLILRYGTIYGKEDENNSIYKIVKEALKTKKIKPFGTSIDQREYIHITDVVKCTLELIEKRKNETVEIAGINKTKAKDLCFLLQDILGEDYEVEYKMERPEHHYVVSPYKANEICSKYISDSYIDLGAGIAELINRLKEK